MFVNPQPGQFVKCLIKGNLSIEGVVLSWSTKDSVLESEKTKEKIIIHNTAYNVIITIVKSTEEKNIQESKKESLPQDLNLRTKKLVDLRMEEAKAEKEVITKKLRTFELSAQPLVTYEGPNDLFKHSSTKETSKSKNSNFERLRKMQRKE